MRLRTQIHLFTSIAFLIVLVMTIIFWLHHARLDEIAVIEERSLAAASKAASLQSLTHEYFVHSEVRVAQQWLSQQKALADLLRERGPSYPSIAPVAHIKVDELTELFQRLKVVSPDESTSFNIRQKKFLAQQLLIDTEIVSDEINEWGSNIRKTRIAFERTFKNLTIAIPLFTLAILLLLSFLLNRRVLIPLQNLHRAVVAVSKGDLSFRSDYRRNDELGDLSRTFDAMAVDLVSELRKEIADRKQAERVLSESEARFRLLVENAPDAIFVRDKECFTYLNNAALKLFGAGSADELIGTPIIERYHPESRDKIRNRMARLNEERKAVPQTQSVCLQLDGTEVNVESVAVPITFQGDEGALIFLRNITDRIEEYKQRQILEEQLHQIQKVESIGQLAGGVAHDFNNMLGVILGHAEMALLNADPASPSVYSLQEIRTAAKRSADLTRQLLTFARKQIISPKVLNLNEAFAGSFKLLQRLIGENIQLSWNPATELWPVKVDPSQIDQILANLCANARDAIAGNGKISIRTENRTLDEGATNALPYDVVPGDYVLLSVSDDGCGMDKQVQAHIFEPFYTTKEVGSGTGLGLATVYGAVKQNHGFMNVYSEVGLGTVFNIYLPRTSKAVEAKHETAEKPLLRGTETILLVEDDEMLLHLVTTMLEESGYTVLSAATTELAQTLAREHSGQIELLISDMIMPAMNGRELSAKLQPLRPEMKVLFISGYTADIISNHGVIEDEINFLQKPFSFEALTAKVREVLHPH